MTTKGIHRQYGYSPRTKKMHAPNHLTNFHGLVKFKTVNTRNLFDANGNTSPGNRQGSLDWKILHLFCNKE